MGKSFIQHADFSSEGLEILSYDSAKAAIENFKWAGEFSRLLELKNQKKEFCPPGIGLWRGAKFMHVFILDPGKYTAIIKYITGNKLLGFIPSSSEKQIQKEGITMPQVLNILELFYQDKLDQLEKLP